MRWVEPLMMTSERGRETEEERAKSGSEILKFCHN